MTGSRTLPSSRSAMAVVAAIASLVLCSCGGGADQPSDPATAPSGTAAGSESPTAPTVEEKTAELDGVKFTAPSGWYVKPEDGSYVIGAPEDADGFSPGSGIFNVGTTLASDVDQLAKAAIGRVETAYPDGKRLPDVKYGGTTFFHLRGSNSAETFDQYGAVVGDRQVFVAWSFNPEFVSRKEVDELINQVMPSFEFEG
ncbi:hypothetical protein ACFVDI_10815 [Nocardioides sp. NPDC057767]|uniref:hypothetical protein n=1 Tax=unclassified Nocardioides TaxID=2615069 RepID=UPI0036724A1B